MQTTEKKTKNNKKKIAKNTMFMYFRTFLVMLITLYTSRVVLDVLGETDYGIYNLIAGIVVFFAFMNTAMSAATQRYLNFYLGREDDCEVRRVFSMSFITHIIILLIIFCLGETIGLWFVETQLNIPEQRTESAFWVFQFSLLCCCISIIRIPYHAIIIAYERMNFYAYLSIIEVLLKLGVVYLLLICSIDHLVLYSSLILLVAFLVLVVYWLYCNHLFFTSHVIWFWDKSLFAKLFSFSGWSLFGSVANITVNQGLSVFVNLFYGVTLNASLGIAHQVQAALTSFISSFQTAFSPQIVKCYAANEHSSFINLIFQSSRLSYCLVFIFAIPLLFYIDPILGIWLKDVPSYTASFSIIYIVYCMLDALAGPLWVSVQASGNIKKYQVQISTLIILNLPLAYLVLYSGLSPVVALSFRAAINALAYIYRIIYLSNNMSFPGLLYVREVTIPVLIMTVISVFMSFFVSRLSTNMNLSICCFLFLIIFNFLLVYSIALKSSERTFIVQFIKQRIER